MGLAEIFSLLAFEFFCLPSGGKEPAGHFGHAGGPTVFASGALAGILIIHKHQQAAGNVGAGTKTLKSCGSGFSAAGINGTNLVAASSPDGRTWTQTSTGFASPTVYGAGCHGSSYLLAYTTTGGPLTGTIGVSTDGRNYSQVAVGGTEVPMGVASSGSVIMALDASSDYYTSTNSGASYSGAAAIGQASPWRSLVYSNGRFYAIFYSAPNCNILFSTGGAWSSAGSFSCAASPTWNGALASGSLILIVGTVSSTPLVIRSTDGGSTWTQDSISESGVTSIADALVP